jgi:hypothetical protein
LQRHVLIIETVYGRGHSIFAEREIGDFKIRHQLIPFCDRKIDLHQLALNGKLKSTSLPFLFRMRRALSAE